MSVPDEIWREQSREFYRAALAFLNQIKAAERQDLSYYIEEMTEALLDLKEAVIEGNAQRAWNARLEFRFLQSEVEERLGDES